MFDIQMFCCKQNEVFISIDYDKLKIASEQERLKFTSDLFLGLTRAITEYGCSVDISNTETIRVCKE